MEDIEKLYPNWRERFASLADAIKCHTGNQDAVIANLRRDNDALRGADALVRAIEDIFPDWRNYRDLSECVRMQVGELERALRDERALSMDPRIPDAHWMDENGKEYTLKWDYADPSVGCFPGYVCDELDDLVTRLSLAEKVVEAAREFRDAPFTPTREDMNRRHAAECRLHTALRTELAAKDAQLCRMREAYHRLRMSASNETPPGRCIPLYVLHRSHLGECDAAMGWPEYKNATPPVKE